MSNTQLNALLKIMAMCTKTLAFAIILSGPKGLFSERLASLNEYTGRLDNE